VSAVQEMSVLCRHVFLTDHRMRFTRLCLPVAVSLISLGSERDGGAGSRRIMSLAEKDAAHQYTPELIIRSFGVTRHLPTTVASKTYDQNKPPRQLPEQFELDKGEPS
jgi:hypothetical protein